MLRRFALLACVGALVSACGSSATVGSVGAPAAAKWVGPPVPSPAGGTVRFALYYGPWQCSAGLYARCERRCATESAAPLRGCLWLADIKGDWTGRWAALPAEAGGRLAITHCCCSYATTDGARARRQWNNAREGYRNDWAREFGAWPQQPGGGEMWPGHHIRDLFHGGHPTARDNVLPVPRNIHEDINRAYPACYAGDARWRSIGPDRPYAD